MPVSVINIGNGWTVVSTDSSGTTNVQGYDEDGDPAGPSSQIGNASSHQDVVKEFDFNHGDITYFPDIDSFDSFDDMMAALPTGEKMGNTAVPPGPEQQDPPPPDDNPQPGNAAPVGGAGQEGTGDGDAGDGDGAEAGAGAGAGSGAGGRRRRQWWGRRFCALQAKESRRRIV